MKMSNEECKTFLNKIYDEHGIDGFVKHKGIINRNWFLNNIHPVPERNEYEKKIMCKPVVYLLHGVVILQVKQKRELEL